MEKKYEHIFQNGYMTAHAEAMVVETFICVILGILIILGLTSVEVLFPLLALVFYGAFRIIY